MITTFNVPKISSDDCAEAIQQAVGPVPGVEDVVVNVPARLVMVKYNPELNTAERLKEEIEAAGYPVQRYSDGRR